MGCKWITCGSAGGVSAAPVAPVACGRDVKGAINGIELCPDHFAAVECLSDPVAVAFRDQLPGSRHSGMIEPDDDRPISWDEVAVRLADVARQAFGMVRSPNPQEPFKYQDIGLPEEDYLSADRARIGGAGSATWRPCRRASEMDYLDHDWDSPFYFLPDGHEDKQGRVEIYIFMKVGPGKDDSEHVATIRRDGPIVRTLNAGWALSPTAIGADRHDQMVMDMAAGVEDDDDDDEEPILAVPLKDGGTLGTPDEAAAEGPSARPSRRRWNVWSRGKAGWMVVDSGNEGYARAGAHRRHVAAQKNGITDAEFVALPAGEKP